MRNQQSISPALHKARESAKVVDCGVGRERVHAAQTAARACLAGIVLALASNDSCNSATCGSGACGCAACCNGDGSWGCGGVGVDVLETTGGECGTVFANGKGFEVGHGLVASGSGVDAEDHAFAAVDAVLLFAVEPWDRC
jgi:hypothetical protein